MKIQDFYTGHAFDVYEVLGAHPGPEGTRFAVWAPSARAVSVVGDWSDGETPLQRSREISGVWNDVVIDNSELMKSLDSAVLTIDREIRRKLQEFGYIEEDGTLIKDYNINILEMLYEKAGE